MKYMLNKFLNIFNAFQNPWEDEKPRHSNNNDDIQNIVRKSKEKINQIFGSNGKGDGTNGSDPKKVARIALLLLVGLPLLGWLSTGFYTVDLDQQGVVTRFGRYNRISDPGLNYKLPDPIELVEKISVTRINKEFIGIRSSVERSSSSSVSSIFGNNSSSSSDKQEKADLSIPEESQMLTGDGNIIDLHFFVQWHVKNPKDYLFNIRDDAGESTVRSSAESAIRQVIGTVKLYEALSDQRQSIEQKTRVILQQMLDSYGSGISITSLGILYSYVPPEVRDAYRDIQSAKADKEREINQAYSYRNDIIPKARGEGQAVISEAKAYKDAVVLRAAGESEKFNTIYAQYTKAKDVTRKRLYIETMEDVMLKTKKIIVDSNSKGLLQMMSLSDMMKNSKGAQQ